MQNTNYLDTYFAKNNPESYSKAAIAYLAALDYLSVEHSEISEKIIQELKDQRSNLKMIASENYSSLAVQLAMGNLLSDKYAEGYPFHRFYAGCDNIDAIEHLASERAKQLFGCDHAYVQPHSGADANLVAFWAILLKNVQSKEVERLQKKSIDAFTPEEYEALRQLMVNQKLLGMSLNSGGHLTHGFRHNISSKMMKASFYDVDPKTEELDYAQILERAKAEKPTILLAGYSAHTKKINFAKMKEIATSVGATLMVDMAHFAGLVAGGVFTGEYNPIAFGDVITSTTHKTLRGPRGGLVLCTNEYAEYVNKGCPLVLGGPLPHVMAAKACAFKEALAPEFSIYSQKVVNNAQALAEGLAKRGIRLISGGTENHMVIIDVSPFAVSGRQAELALREAKITVNRNAIPFDPSGPWYTSGVRLGTPALTSLGMQEEQMHQIANIIADALAATKASPAIGGGMSKSLCTTDPSIFATLQSKVEELLENFVLYPELCLDEKTSSACR